jgi:hypothetical protein
MFEVKIEVNYERKMSKSLDVLAIPVVSIETFVEQEFENDMCIMLKRSDKPAKSFLMM